MIAIRRRDQIDFIRNPNPSPIAADQLIGGYLFCETAEGRERWVRRLHEKHPLRFNHFVFYQDVQSEYALSFGHGVPMDRLYVSR